MTALDFLYIILGIGFIVLVTFLSIAAYNLIVTLHKLNIIIDNVSDITSDVDSIKNTLKSGFMTILTFILNNLNKKRVTSK